jgi:DNA mismatch repair ATPase MutL
MQQIPRDGRRLRHGAPGRRHPFLRHATSKLRDEARSGAIATLGFRARRRPRTRGLPRELTNRTPGAAEGTRVVLTAGDIDEMGPAAAGGQTILVRVLFYKRRRAQKFMKFDARRAAPA